MTKSTIKLDISIKSQCQSIKNKFMLDQKILMLIIFQYQMDFGKFRELLWIFFIVDSRNMTAPITITPTPTPPVPSPSPSSPLADAPSNSISVCLYISILMCCSYGGETCDNSTDW